MLVLHATWSESANELHLWAEDPARPMRVARRARSKAARPHPFAADFEHIGDALRGPLDGAMALEELEVEDVSLLLPSGRRGPRPSPRLLPDEPVEPEAIEGLSAWTVPALLLPAGPASAVLARLREPDALVDAPLVLSESVRCFAEIERLAEHLADRGAWIPSVQREDDELVARWRPFGLTGAEQKAVQALAHALPVSARSEPWSFGGAVDRDGSEVTVATPLGFVRAALQAFVDHRVRSLRGGGLARDLEALGAPRTKRKGADRPEALHRELLTALAGAYPVLDAASPAEAEALGRSLLAWTAAARLDAPHRTCFRLVPPDLEELAPDPDAWAIEFTLQSRDDPSLFAPAEDVWAGAPSAEVLATSGADPQEHLLASLATAARLHAPLEPVLKEAAPCRLATDAEGAWSFLREGVPLLEQAGFGVLVPTWWGDRRAGLGLKVRARTKPQESDVVGGEMGGNALLQFSWVAAVGDEELTEDELRAMAAAKVPLVRVRGRWVEVQTAEITAALDALQAQGDGSQELTAVELLRLAAGLEAGPAGLPVVSVEAEGALGQLLVGDARPRARRTGANFVGALRAYQRRGLSWLAFLESCGLGACLADDMGLGKTVQILALLAGERAGRKAMTKAGRPGATLLVCPLSVVGNWAKEAARFVPTLRVTIHHGPDRLAGEPLAEQIRDTDLLITTYALATRDQEDLAAHQWHRLVLDEAQAIKNPGTRQSRAVRTFATARRVALTGTPVENRLGELHSLMNFLNPGLLGSAAAFRRGFAIPIERDGDTDRGERLRRLTRPFVLRRLKTDPKIAPDLPDKVERNVECRLSREQVTLYQAVVDDLTATLDKVDGMERRGAILAAMTKLKQVCDHPALFLADRSDLDGRSGKLAQTEEILEELLAAGDTVLVFTQYAEMGKLLRPHLQHRFGEEVMLLHGGATRAARERMVERFQSPGGPRIFVLSLLAAGTGLNLTAANHVIHFDRWWNPAVEDQATDRTYRIGQHRNVLVHKLVCVGTLEERIDAMIERKKALADLVVGTGEDWLTELSTDEIRSVVALSASALRED